MLKNNIKIALRSLLKNKRCSIINVLGLAIGISAAYCIFLFIRTELSYDSHHKNKINIYRVLRTDSENGELYKAANTPGPLALKLKNNFPQVRYAARVWGWHRADIKVGDKTFKVNNVTYMDQDALQMFTIPFLSGNIKTAFLDVNSIILRESLAKKYFENERAFGKIIYLNNEAYKISGIIKETNHLSHMKFDVLIPFHKLELKYNWLKSWIPSVPTYVQLYPDASASELDVAFSEYSDKHVRFFKSIDLQPLSRIHLYSRHIKGEQNYKEGSIASVHLFFTIAMLLLIIACINFINLTIVKSSQKEKEISTRKVNGAKRFQVIFQLITESILLVLIACILSLGFLRLWLKIFNPLLDGPIFLQWIDYVYILCLSVSIGIVAGLYPAFQFSRGKAFHGLYAEKAFIRNKAYLSKILISFQFGVAIILIVCTFTIYLQRDFMLNKDLGFSKENIICVPIRNDNERAKITVLKQELLKNNHIHSVAATTEPTGYGTLEIRLFSMNDQSNSAVMEIGSIDADYIPTLEMEIIKGRNFMEGNISDVNECVILNEAACKELGWDDPVGKEFMPIHSPFVNKSTVRVVGVVKNFHFNSVHSEIKPLVFFMVPSRYRHLVMRVQQENIQQTMERIKHVWKTILPQSQFQFRFLDEKIEAQYRDELKINRVVSYFTLLIVIISCIGLFGLISLTVEQKIKEIGVRKVNGAKVREILAMLNANFIKWIVIAFIIACPVAWYSMHKWLENFAYKTEINWWIFVLAGSIALVIALITVSWQSWKAASRNPVEALRYE